MSERVKIKNVLVCCVYLNRHENDLFDLCVVVASS